MDLTECSLCNEQYNESTRRARSLTCHHYFCNQCLNQIIKSSNPRCPSCRTNISARSAETLHPNFLMDELISKMKSGFQSMPMSNEGEDGVFSAGDCSRHRKCQLNFTCRSHKVRICRDCTVLDHNPSHCEIISFEDELKETKESTISDVKTHKSKREENIKELLDIITESEATIQKHQDEIKKLQTKVNERKEIVNKANAGIRDCKENKTRLESVQRELASSTTVNQINQACKQAESVLKSSNSLEKSMETTFNIIGFRDIADQGTAALVKKVLQNNATVHATAEVNGMTRYSQLLVKDGHVLLPALASSNSPPSPTKTVNVSYLLSSFSNTNIFLTLAIGGNELGTVYFTLRDNTYAKYIWKLCMGTIGPSYRGAKFEDVGGSYLSTAEVSKYDSSICTEPPPARLQAAAVQKGTVYIIDTTRLSFFMINVEYSSCVVGDVNNGMSVLEKANTYKAGEVSITDVGIVLK